MSGLLRLFPSFMFRNFRKFPFFIFHHVYHFRNIAVLSRLLCSVISGIFRHSYINIISSFRNIPWLLPSFLLRHLRTSRPEYTVVFLSYVPSVPEMSVVFPSYIFRHFRNFLSFIFHQYFIISGLLRLFSVFHAPSFPGISVFHISSCLSFPEYSGVLPFFLFCHFRKFLSFIFHHFRIIPSSSRFGRPEPV